MAIHDPTKAPRPVDTHIGQKIRERRILLGLSQEKLGSLIGVSFQMVQKMERAQNRTSASRLFVVAQHLHMRIADFFPSVENAPVDPIGISSVRHSRLVNDISRAAADIRPDQQAAVLKVIRAMSAPTIDTVAQAAE